MFKLTSSTPLGGASKSWPGLEIKEHFAGELVSLAYSRANTNAFHARFEDVFNALPPKPNQSIQIKDGTAFWSGPDQIMLLLDGEDINADKTVAQQLADLAYTTLQSDSWAALSVSGERIYDLLERLIALDVREAPTGFAARTSAHHMSVIVLKKSETECLLLTPRSFALSFYEALCHTSENVLDAVSR